MTPAGFLFELSGGTLCLDLVNTLDKRPTPEPEEHLETYADLLSWAEQAGVVGGREGALLGKEAGRDPGRTAAVLAKVRELREALFAVFSAAADRRPPPRQALAILNGYLPSTLGTLEVAPKDGGYALERAARSGDPGAIIHPVVESACELLVSSRLDRVRRCEAEGCDWLFLDTSRNRSRRWCDMSVCGNRAKARRHYARTRTSRRRNNPSP